MTLYHFISLVILAYIALVLSYLVIVVSDVVRRARAIEQEEIES